MKPREYRSEPPLWLLGSLVALLLIVILGLLATPAWSSELALGDSLALGFGQASGMPTRASVGVSSCRILHMTPTMHFDFVLLSAGTNDPPGRCVEALRARLNAGRVQWVVPVNAARSRVLAVASAHGDATLFYTPGARSWPHPGSYWNVKGRCKPVVHRHKPRPAGSP
jgi:hypothetical protein